VASGYDVARFDLPPARADDLAAVLWRLGSAGSWSPPAGCGILRVEAFFERGAAPAERELRAAAASAGARLVEVVPAEERDWAAEWRASATPIEVGEQFLVDPREPGDGGPAEPAGRFLLRLPARTAFGVGSHESTRLAVELLEAQAVAGARVLDVGTGTGILALAALRLGARRVVACDLDPAAALLLASVMALNGARFDAFAGTVAALAPAACFDLALVNVVPAEIAGDLPALVTLLAPGAVAIFSGILETQEAEALAALARHGLRERTRRSAGEWSAFATERG
jgi:ribosomal protein L11 methyltransferase